MAAVLKIGIPHWKGMGIRTQSAASTLASTERATPNLTWNSPLRVGEGDFPQEVGTNRSYAVTSGDGFAYFAMEPRQNNVDGIDLGESIEAKILQRKQLQAAAPESPKYALPRKKQNIDDKGADINGADNGADVNVDDIEAKIAKRKAALEADKVVKKDGK